MSVNSRNDQTFLNRLTEIVEANLKDEQFGVNELSDKIRMSRSQIHRKLKSISNQSVSQFIREIRLKKAKEMLEQNNETVSEIAYLVGFGSPSYFIKCFKEYFGYSPGETGSHILPEDKREKLGNAQADKNLSDKKHSWIINKKAILIPVVLLIVIGIVLVYNRVIETKKSDLSIVVLPFKNLSDNPANQYFAGGITEDILNNLYWITSLNVVSRTTGEVLGENNYSVREIAQRLNVRYVLEGSVRIIENEVRISVQLIDAKNDVHIWSDYFDRELDDIIGIQGKIAMLVANKLKAVLSEKEVKRIEKISTRSAKAYDNYMQARFLLHKANSPQRQGFDRNGVLSCIQYYEKAIEEDPGFADAYAGLANASFNLSAWGILPGMDGFLRSRTLSLKAIEIDPECAEAHAVLGSFLVWGIRDFENGGKELETAVSLNPNFATARQWYAQYLMITGPINEARIQINRALDLEPYFWVIQNLNAWITYFEKDYKKSRKICEMAQDFNPNFSDNMWLFFLNDVKLNKGEQARDQLKTIARNYSGTENHSAPIDSAYNADGITGLFNWLIEINKKSPIPVEGMNGGYFYLAWWNAILGNANETLYWLEQNITYKRPVYHYFNLINNHPDFEFVKNNPRFLEVVDKIGLTPFIIVSE